MGVRGKRLREDLVDGRGRDGGEVVYGYRRVLKEGEICGEGVGGKVKGGGYVVYGDGEWVRLEDVWYVCCDSRNDFMGGVKRGMKCRKNGVGGIGKEGYFYIGMKGVGLF